MSENKKSQKVIREVSAEEFDFSGYRMPAEWGGHEATWLAWPVNQETWPEHLEAVQRIFVEMMEHLCQKEVVHLCIRQEEVERFKKLISDDLTGRVILHDFPYNDSWMRDAGPIFLCHSDPDKGRIAQDFIFNTWGGKYGPWDDDDILPRFAGEFLGETIISHEMVLEGGSIEVNGAGTVLTTEQCLLNKNRNPQWNKGEIEERLRRYLGVEQVLWLKNGIEGDDTDGHIDDLTRFVDEATVLTVICEDQRDPNYEVLKENAERLSGMRVASGKCLEVVELPMPKRLVEGPFGRSPASYANFYIANELVLVPVYSDVHDEHALNTIQDVFPERRVVGIECSALVAGLGSIHCVTQQQPDRSVFFEAGVA